MMWWLLGGLALLLPGVLFLVGRRSESRAMQDWELVVTPRGCHELDRAAGFVDSRVALLDFTCDHAQEARDAGRTADAMRMLDQGCTLIEEYCPTMLRSLAALSVLSRMVSAMAPAPPLRPSAFRLRQLEGLARLNQLLHHFVVTTGERFRLRLYFLARAFQTLLRVVAGATRRARQAGRAAPEWSELEAARHDVRALSDEWLASFRLLLLSLAADARQPGR
jgi:hypothetical protein